MADTFIDDLDWVSDELITSTKFNQWWANMQNFHNGTAFGDGIIVTRHLGSDANLQIPPANLGGIWWEELARTTLASSSDTINLGTFPARRFLQIQLIAIPTGGSVDCRARLNGDATANYAYRTSDNGGADTTGGSQSDLYIDSGTGSWPHYSVTDVINITNQEKLLITRAMGRNTAGAANVPVKREIINKWANTSAQITSLVVTNGGGTGDYAVGSQVVVLGHD